MTPIARFGNAGVGTLVGPGTVNLSLGLGKAFRLATAATTSILVKFIQDRLDLSRTEGTSLAA